MCIRDRHGPFAPHEGHRFNPNKLLIDPYAKALDGDVRFGKRIFGYPWHQPEDDLAFSKSNSAPLMPKAVVIDPRFDWEGDELLRTPWHETVIYELHVRGFTRLHPDIPPELRGTYAGLAHPAAIAHLRSIDAVSYTHLDVYKRQAATPPLLSASGC